MKKNSLIIFFVNLVLLACTNSGRSADDTFSGQSVRKDTMFIESQKVALCNSSFHITVPNDLDSMEILRAAILKLEKSAFQGKIPVSVYDSTSVNGFFVGQGINSSVKLYKSLPDKGAIKVLLFAYLRECHNDSYPALELQTFDSENRFIDRLLVSASIFEEGGLYRYSAVDKNYRVKVTDVIVSYDLENDADQESVTE